MGDTVEVVREQQNFADYLHARLKQAQMELKNLIEMYGTRNWTEDQRAAIKRALLNVKHADNASREHLNHLSGSGSHYRRAARKVELNAINELLKNEI